MAQTQAFAIISLHLGTNSLLQHNPPYWQVTQMPLFILLRLLSPLWVFRKGSASDWCALQEVLDKCIQV